MILLAGHGQSCCSMSLVGDREDRKMKQAVQDRFSKACASVGLIFSRDLKISTHLQCAPLVTLLVRVQQAILQACASQSLVWH